MTENNRKYPRTTIELDVEVSFGTDITSNGRTTDISEGGMFFTIEQPDRFPLGDMVMVRYNDPLNNEEDTTKDAVIVRVADHGIAVAYVDLDAF